MNGHGYWPAATLICRGAIWRDNNMVYERAQRFTSLLPRVGLALFSRPSRFGGLASLAFPLIKTPMPETDLAAGQGIFLSPNAAPEIVDHVAIARQRARVQLDLLLRYGCQFSFDVGLAPLRIAHFI